jgi:hypothetical protein
MEKEVRYGGVAGVEAVRSCSSSSRQSIDAEVMHTDHLGAGNTDPPAFPNFDVQLFWPNLLVHFPALSATVSSVTAVKLQGCVGTTSGYPNRLRCIPLPHD